MLSFIPYFRNRLDSTLIPLTGVVFLALLALTQAPLQSEPARSLVLTAMLACCLALFSLVSFRWWNVGWPAVFLLTAVAAYLVIGNTVLFFKDEPMQLRVSVRQIFFPLVSTAAILSGRALLEKWGAEKLLGWMLLILTASCAFIAMSPLLRFLGIMSEFRVNRATGAFNDPNNAGMIACLTAILALVFIYRERRSWLAYLALGISCLAAILTFSITSLITLAFTLSFLGALNIRYLKQSLPLIGLFMLGALIAFILSLFISAQTFSPLVISEAFIDTVSDAEEFAEHRQIIIQRLNSLRGGTIIGVGGTIERVELWQMGIEEAQKSPLVGNGLHKFHYIDSTRLTSEAKGTGVHNIYLTLLGEAGVVPLALYLLCLFFLLRTLWTAPRGLAKNTVVGWTVAMALFGIPFQHLLTMGAFNFIIGFTCAMALFAAKSEPRQSFRDAPSPRRHYSYQDQLLHPVGDFRDQARTPSPGEAVRRIFRTDAGRRRSRWE